MISDVETLAREALMLPRREQLLLVQRLLDEQAEVAEDDIQNAWDEEISTRIAAIDAGHAHGIPYEQVQQELARHFKA